MSTLLIDDIRTPELLGGIVVDEIARDYASGIGCLAREHFDLLLLDHDLADFTGPGNSERKGIHIIFWLARPENRRHIPGQIVCVSANPIGHPDIMSAVTKLYSDPDQLLILDSEYMQRLYEQ